ncbi:MAG: LytR C-terminal domain-containing protein [Thermoleophilia bacterium]|nr:LytR C-terminal domain-containing protein [Thermoleophilia bacterium]
MDWLEILVMSAAVLSVLAFIGLGILLVRQGHSLRRLQEQVAAGGDEAATAPSMDRLRRLRAEARATAPAAGDAAPAPVRVSDPGRGRRLALIGGLGVLVLALAAGGAWFLFIRDSGSGTTAVTPPPPPPPPAPPSDRVPQNPPPLDNKAAYTVAILNGSGVTGFAATRVVPRVQQAGYSVGAVDNARRDDVQVSMVMYSRGNRVVAQNVAKDLGIRKAPPLGPVAAGRTGGADAVVIVGRDIAGSP